MGCTWENSLPFMLPDETVIGYNHTFISYPGLLQRIMRSLSIWSMTLPTSTDHDTYRQGRSIITEPSVEHSAYQSLTVLGCFYLGESISLRNWATTRFQPWEHGANLPVVVKGWLHSCIFPAGVSWSSQVE